MYPHAYLACPGRAGIGQFGYLEPLQSPGVRTRTPFTAGALGRELLKTIVRKPWPFPGKRCDEMDGERAPQTRRNPDLGGSREPQSSTSCWTYVKLSAHSNC